MDMKELLKKWIKKYFISAGIFSFFVNTFNLTFSIYMLAIYDRVLFSFSIPTLITITIGAILAIVVMACLDFLRSRILVLAGVEMEDSLSHKVLKEMIKDASQINSQGYREGLRDLNVLRNYFGGNAIFFIFDSPWVPIYLFVIYLMHPYLAALAVFGGIISFLLGFLQQHLTTKRLEMARAVEDQASRILNLAISNAESIVGMNMLPGITARFNEKNTEVLKLQTEANKFIGMMSSISKSFRSLMPILVYGTGAYLVIKSEVSVGAIIAASIITRQFLSPIDQAMSTWKQTVDARGAYKRLNEFLKERLEEKRTELPAPQGRLTLEQVSLSISGRMVLRNISFSVEPGELIGIIGPSGAGKSTLCRIILGIWPPSSGKVKLDGADIFQWDRERLGKYIGYLPQEVQLFSGTISENIARMEHVDSSKVIEAAKLAGVHEFILSLPRGYDTDIGERGRMLSGGQRQRIGLARALFGEPRLIVLDEPNSNLDDIGERMLIMCLNNLKKRGITTLVVSHRPSILTVVDKILVIKEGQVAGFGPKEEIFKMLSGAQPVKPVPKIIKK
jgi:PrtD family type I secretion system ABC transporter